MQALVAFFTLPSVQPQSGACRLQVGNCEGGVCFVYPFTLFDGLEFHPKLKVKQFPG